MRILRDSDFFHSDQHAFCLFTMNNQLMEGVHGHEFDELVIVRDGSGFHIVNDIVHFICKGDFFIVTKNDTHSYVSTNHLSVINILIRRNHNFHFLQHIDTLLQCVKTQLQSRNDRTLTSRALANIEAWSDQIVSRNENDYDALYFSQCEAAFLNVVNTLCQCGRQTEVLNAEERGQASLIRTLKSNCLRQLDWGALSDESGVARRTMFRFIKRITGYTPVRFQMLFRVLKAQELLRTTDKTVSEIAARCGFMNGIRLTESYRRYFNYSPTHERELHSRVLTRI
ncbi:helix-turn-helix domain-containing protein [Kluyvera ascorbata]|uniref:helix-turn-helix domain-containing protein n=1 Tax=Kluyvera ascorbata TaxID=51288 RepID=UPI002940DD5B|nr:helix-turn-helix domain-containing protein [Kluyvera ascorbata]HED1310060.1 helix-turn-helix domain-containing protein [Kluyvera ascorbata]